MAIAAAVASSLLVGVLVYVFLMRKMTGEMVLAAVLTTVALGIFLRGVIVLVWSAQQQYPSQALQIANFAIALPGGARISLCAALLVLTTALVYGTLLAFLRFGRWAWHAPRAKIRCWPPSAASICTPSTRWHGAFPR